MNEIMRQLDNIMLKNLLAFSVVSRVINILSI